MRILFCGKDSFTYHRTRVLIEGLRKHPHAGCELFSITGRNRENGKELSKRSAEADFVLVPAFRHKDVGWVKQYSRAPVVFDPLISTFLTRVVDYGHYHKAPMKYLFDLTTLRKADLLISDTLEMKKYYSRRYGIAEDRIGVVQDGYITDEFFPTENKHSDAMFHAGFYGSFVPLQGADIIAEAAALLRNEDIVFEIIGAGAMYASFERFIQKNKLNNVIRHGWLRHDQLPDAIGRLDLCLGIFGRSGKAARVVPNKLFHYAAKKKCIVTRESPALYEVFHPGHDIVAIGCHADALAESILDLKRDAVRREQIAAEAYKTISEGFTELKIAEALLSFLKECGAKMNFKRREV